MHFSSDFDKDLKKDRCDCEISAKSLFILNYRLRFFASRFFSRSIFCDFFSFGHFVVFFCSLRCLRRVVMVFTCFVFIIFLVRFFFFLSFYLSLLSSIFFLFFFFFLFTSLFLLQRFSFFPSPSVLSHPLRLFIRVSFFAFFTIFPPKKERTIFKDASR